MLWEYFFLRYVLQSFEDQGCLFDNYDGLYNGSKFVLVHSGKSVTHKVEVITFGSKLFNLVDCKLNFLSNLNCSFK